MSSIAHGVAQIDASRPEIRMLIAEIIEAVLNYFEEQDSNSNNITIKPTAHLRLAYFFSF